MQIHSLPLGGAFGAVKNSGFLDNAVHKAKLDQSDQSSRKGGVWKKESLSELFASRWANKVKINAKTMKVFFDLACMSTCCWGLPKPKNEPFITHYRGTLISPSEMQTQLGSVHFKVELFSRTRSWFNVPSDVSLTRTHIQTHVFLCTHVTHLSLALFSARLYVPAGASWPLTRALSCAQPACFSWPFPVR